MHAVNEHHKASPHIKIQRQRSKAGGINDRTMETRRAPRRTRLQAASHQQLDGVASRRQIENATVPTDGASVEMITLPWPPRELHPNSRPHWAKKAKATKACRERAGWEIKAAGEVITWDGPIYISLVFCPPDKRRRDLDGCLSSCKAYCDGLADGLKVDDSRFRPSLDWGPVVKGGQIRVYISPTK